MLKTLIFYAVDKTGMSILLTFPKVFGTGSFSKEELLDYDLTQDAIRTLLKSLLEKRDLGRLILP